MIYGVLSPVQEWESCNRILPKLRDWNVHIYNYLYIEIHTVIYIDYGYMFLFYTTYYRDQQQMPGIAWHCFFSGCLMRSIWCTHWSKERLIVQEATVTLLQTYGFSKKSTFNQFWAIWYINLITQTFVYLYIQLYICIMCMIQHVQMHMMRPMNVQFLDGKHKHTQFSSAVCLNTSSCSYQNAEQTSIMVYRPFFLSGTFRNLSDRNLLG